MSILSEHKALAPNYHTGNDGKGFYIRTFTGKKFYFDRPEDNEYDIRDIAHALSMNCRWTGHVKKFFSVAQHSVLASWLVPREHTMSALLHDATEAYLHDMPSPLKWHLKEHGFTILSTLEKRIDAAIFKAFDLPYPRDPAIKGVDLRLLATESRDFMPEGEERLHMIEPYPWSISSWSCKVAERQFLSAYDFAKAGMRRADV